MGPSKLRKAIGAVKDQTSIGLAKVSGSASLSDIEVAIVKATRHEEYPAEEKHIREILSFTLYARYNVGPCVNIISRRLSKTKNWVVALKALVLIQRLLSESNHEAFEQEIFFSTRRGTRLLNMTDFRDASRSNSWDFSAFVRTYALYLDEQLEYRMQSRRGKRSSFSYEEEHDAQRYYHQQQQRNQDQSGGASTAIVVRTPVAKEMQNEALFSKVNHLMQILDRFLACKPTGSAKHHMIVLFALYPIIKESFQLYDDITEILSILLQRFRELNVPDSVKVHEIFCRAAKQYDDLEDFYKWCMSTGIARSSEYPQVETISQNKLDVMDDIIREKSLGHGSRRLKNIDLKSEKKVEEKNEEPKEEEDMNAIKALPPPEGFPEESNQEGEADNQEEEKKEEKKGQDIGDLLNLGEDAPTPEEHGDKLALALFDGGAAAAVPAPSGPTPWEAFRSDSGTDWETALVQSASHLSNQKTTLSGGFDTLMLDGLYQQGAVNQAVVTSGVIATGSASSVAFGSAGKPAMLALPAPPSADGGANAVPSGSDPFTASLAVAPPPYVQMAEMEKKQMLLVEEQVTWQKYSRGGMQGVIGLDNLQYNPYAHPYSTGGSTRTY